MNNESILLAQKVDTILKKKKFDSLQVLDVHEITSLADVFIIIVGNNTKQTKALADDIEEGLSKLDIEAVQKEGYQSANWILMDYDRVIIHVLYKEDAEFYGLDRLWQDGTEILF
ncbi:MAG: ribosome silencing factor [Niameybacter sp.]|uniref:ribosome silencing factor n=1 Tax=Niameybacter sp. TaxID=2033640 RepID=UPI002FCBA1D4